jgi:hypothetical protein
MSSRPLVAVVLATFVKVYGDNGVEIVVPIQLQVESPLASSVGTDGTVVDFKLLSPDNAINEVSSFCVRYALSNRSCEVLRLEVKRRLRIAKVMIGEEVPILADYGYNIYSQFGEDGIINKAYEIMGLSASNRRYAVEFGAWDGFHLSNTANLWYNQPTFWKGVLIEGDIEKFTDLAKKFDELNSLPNSSIAAIAINRMVTIDPQNTLYRILLDYDVPIADVDLISIDIDSDDYFVLESILSSPLHPRLIICEYNPTIPAHVDVYGRYGTSMGASVAALKRVAKLHGYELVALTKTNAFFVPSSEFPKFSTFDTSLGKMRIDDSLRYVITNYQGHYTILADKDYTNSFGTIQENINDEDLLGEFQTHPRRPDDI